MKRIATVVLLAILLTFSEFRASAIAVEKADLIIQGGTFNGIQVRGIGRDKAKWLFYNVHVNRLTSNSTFQKWMFVTAVFDPQFTM